MLAADAAAGDFVGFPAFQLKQTRSSVLFDRMFSTLFAVHRVLALELCRSQANPYQWWSSFQADFLVLPQNFLPG